MRYWKWKGILWRLHNRFFLYAAEEKNASQRPQKSIYHTAMCQQSHQKVWKSSTARFFSHENRSLLNPSRRIPSCITLPPEYSWTGNRWWNKMKVGSGMSGIFVWELIRHVPGPDSQVFSVNVTYKYQVFNYLSALATVIFSWNSWARVRSTCSLQPTSFTDRKTVLLNTSGSRSDSFSHHPRNQLPDTIPYFFQKKCCARTDQSDRYSKFPALPECTRKYRYRTDSPSCPAAKPDLKWLLLYQRLWRSVIALLGRSDKHVLSNPDSWPHPDA